MTRGNLWPRPGRWIVPAAVVVACFGSLPLWLGEEFTQPVGDPTQVVDVLINAGLFQEEPALGHGLPSVPR